ncbi:MAG TPA: aminotransferase class V-fold PLP-dependent enzyme [Vicinamibacterales bacterium]|nr:aminotransferase class V-fold PLP-dependent enzyme [Vicinamibacterales bacterium]
MIENELAPHYSRFRVSERLLLTGHSHQAWPDVGFEAQQRAWLDAAELVDDKWQRAKEQAWNVRSGFARLLGDEPNNIVLGQNTHELVTRWLSALPLQKRPRIITTDGEFHTIRRQADRLGEEGLDVVKVGAEPADTLAERLALTVDSRTSCVMVSSVLFESAEIVPNLNAVADACRLRGALLLVDAYHHLNVVPFDLKAMELQDSFVTGGGYKYCQLGEGNAFLRVPSGIAMRPVLTGWFAEFDSLEDSTTGPVLYGKGASAFEGATYDPASHYRASAVFGFHHEQGLTPDCLREINRRQVNLLRSEFEALDVPPSIAHITSMPDNRRGGFLAIHAPRAKQLVRLLRERGVHVDACRETLRLGPAPYSRDDQLRDAVRALREATARDLRRG